MSDDALALRVPSSSPRVRLTGISRRAFEHPADRAALSALRKVPGLDLLLRKLIGFVGERSIRYLYLANAVRVQDGQLPRIAAAYEECLAILDVPNRPELYVAQTPIVNAGAVGVDKPFIVLNSGIVHLLSDDELRFVIGHELGHIVSDHTLYKTMLGMLLQLSITRIGIPLSGLAIFGIIAALREWDRKSELSCDRAGLLCVQDPMVAYTVHMKTAGGAHAGQMSVDALFAQAEDYEKGGSVLDSVMKLMNLLGQRHPFPVTRLAELKRWVDSGAYAAILGGEYPRRTEDEAASVVDDIKAGAQSYQDVYAKSGDALSKFAQDISEAGQSAFDKARDFWNKKAP